MFKLTSLTMAIFLAQASWATDNLTHSKEVVSSFTGFYDLIITDDYSSQYLCPAYLVIKDECNGFAVHTSHNSVERFCNIQAAGKNLSIASRYEDEMINPPLPDKHPPLPDVNPPLPDRGPKRPGILFRIIKAPFSSKEAKVVQVNAAMDVQKSVTIRNGILTRSVKDGVRMSKCNYLKR